MAVILVADDDRHIRELVRLMMEQSGFDVAEAEDGGSGGAADRIRTYRSHHTGCDDAENGRV
ncbi:hypothetical protein BVAD3_32970 [Bacillus velezensis]|nr:hypothetical protein BVAD3_32970 [Bacillus velezensis]